MRSAVGMMQLGRLGGTVIRAPPGGKRQGPLRQGNHRRRNLSTHAGGGGEKGSKPSTSESQSPFSGKRPAADGRTGPSRVGPLDRLGNLVRSRVASQEASGGPAYRPEEGSFVEGLEETGGQGETPLNWNLEEMKLSPGLGFGFSAGGLLFPYFVGNAVALKRLGLVSDETVFAGSSAGSLISACLVCDLSAEELMGNLLEMYRQLREEGTVGNVRSVVETYANMVFPDDVHVRANGRLNVSITRVNKQSPFLQSVYVNDFESKEDLIQALLTSSHVPLYMNTKVTSTYRGLTCVDGGLGTNFIPKPPCEEPVTICCFPNMPFECDIAPGKYSECSYSMRKMLQYALLPPGEDKIIDLFEMGVSDVLDWATHTTKSPEAGKDRPQE
ncbi:PNPLA domain-containing protein [Chloropicon primus]|nr:PNPLA domain-containing protein [Chloropicon primus]|mmetsp:Transcript_4561/g.13568  ORF Transcript_4561/g.13568 Transcript_4561/m.13568 type:complete len:386 (-) Transcript_4561:146-1303(-)